MGLKRTDPDTGMTGPLPRIRASPLATRAPSHHVSPASSSCLFPDPLDTLISLASHVSRTPWSQAPQRWLQSSENRVQQNFTQRRIQGFLDWEGAQPIFWPNFAENSMKMKKIGPRGWGGGGGGGCVQNSPVTKHLNDSFSQRVCQWWQR